MRRSGTFTPQRWPDGRQRPRHGPERPPAGPVTRPAVPFGSRLRPSALPFGRFAARPARAVWPDRQDRGSALTKPSELGSDHPAPV